MFNLSCYRQKPCIPRRIVVAPPFGYVQRFAGGIYTKSLEERTKEQKRERERVRNANCPRYLLSGALLVTVVALLDICMKKTLRFIQKVCIIPRDDFERAKIYNKLKKNKIKSRPSFTRESIYPVAYILHLTSFCHVFAIDTLGVCMCVSFSIAILYYLCTFTAKTPIISQKSRTLEKYTHGY